MSEKKSDGNIGTLEEMLDKLDSKLDDSTHQKKVVKEQKPIEQTKQDTRGGFEELDEVKPKSGDSEPPKKPMGIISETDTQVEIIEFTDEEKRKKFQSFMSATTNNIYSDSSGIRGPSMFTTGEFEQKKLDPEKVKSFRDMKITDSQVEQFDKFHKQRLKKAEKFDFKRNTLSASRIRPLYAIDVNAKKKVEEEPEPLIENDVTDELEYRSEADFESVRDYIGKFKKTSGWITLGLGILFALSFLWQICLLGALNLPLDLTASRPVTFLIINLIFLVAVAVACYDTLLSGLTGLIRRKANADTAVSLMVVGNVIQIICLFFSGSVLSSDKDVFVLTPAAIGCLFFHYIGKYMLAKRSVKNFGVVSSKNNDHYAVGIVTNEDLSSAFTRGTTKNKPAVGYNRKTKFLTDFMYYSFLEDITDNIGYFLAPIGLCIAFILSGATAFIAGSIWIAMTMFAATLCSISAFSFLLSVNMPLSSAQKRLEKYSSALLGYEAATEFGKMDAVITSASKLFPKGTVSLAGMRVFNEHPIDDSMLCAASVLSITRSVLKDMFMEIMLDNEKYLRRVDSVLYEDCLGISAWVDDRRVIIGNYDMMVNHNVDMPDVSEIKKLEHTGCDIIFVSISGQLTAAFMYTVVADPVIADSLVSLESEGILLIAQTVDPLVTSKKLSEIFDVDEGLFKILSAHYHKSYRKQTKHMDRDGSSVVNRGDFVSFAKCVVESRRLFSTSRIGMTLSVTGIIVSILILSLCMATDMLANFSTLSITLFQLFCALVVSMVTFVRR